MEISIKDNIKKTKNQEKENIFGQKVANSKGNFSLTWSMDKVELSMTMGGKLRDYGNLVNLSKYTNLKLINQICIVFTLLILSQE